MFYAQLALFEISRHIGIHGNTLPNACVNEYGWCSLFSFMCHVHTVKAQATSLLYQSLSCFFTYLSPAASSPSIYFSRDINVASSALSIFENSIIHSIEFEIFSISRLLFINLNHLNVLSLSMFTWTQSQATNIVEQIKNL